MERSSQLVLWFYVFLSFFFFNQFDICMTENLFLLLDTRSWVLSAPDFCTQQEIQLSEMVSQQERWTRIGLRCSKLWKGLEYLMQFKYLCSIYITDFWSPLSLNPFTLLESCQVKGNYSAQELGSRNANSSPEEVQGTTVPCTIVLNTVLASLDRVPCKVMLLLLPNLFSKTKQLFSSLKKTLNKKN